jgi:hypothetical protein
MAALRSERGFNVRKKNAEESRKEERGWLNASKRIELSNIPLRRVTLINTCLVENTSPATTL